MVFIPMHYPSKQTIVIFIVCIIAIVCAVIYIDWRVPKGQVVDTDQPSILARVQDGFGDETSSTSTDWKSTFLNMSSSSNSFKTPTDKTATTSAADKLTATENFGRGIFAQYVSLKQVGLDKDPEVVSSTISSLLAQSDLQSDGPRVYTTNDITESQDTSAQALRSYGNTVGLILKANSPAKDDATLALAGLQGKAPSYVDELRANNIKYKAILGALLGTTAPKSVSVYHLGLINGISHMVYISSALQTSETDPLRALSGLRLYGTAFPLIAENIVGIRSTLIEAGITYDGSEGGSFFK